MKNAFRIPVGIDNQLPVEPWITTIGGPTATMTTSGIKVAHLDVAQGSSCANAPAFCYANDATTGVAATWR